jgi:protein O-GlcNAc transferase
VAAFESELAGVAVSLDAKMFPAIPPVEVSANEPQPFWSVIIPAYKPQFLAQCLKSVIDQDPGPAEMEILVIDDCSPADLEPIVRQVGGDRIRYVRNPTNLGTYATENAGLSLARGVFTHILNDDDWVLSGFYSTFKKVLQGQPASVGAACCLYQNVSPDGQPSWRPPAIQPKAGILQDWMKRIGTANMLNPASVVVRREVYEHVGGYHLRMKYCADWEFYKRSAVFYDWWYEPTLLACYREHEENCTYEGLLSGEQVRQLGQAIEISHQYFPYLVRDQISATAREHYAIYSIWRALPFVKSGHVDVGVRLVQEGLKLSSSSKVLEELIRFLAETDVRPIRELFPKLSEMVKSL